MADLPSKIFFIIGGVITVFSFLYNFFLKTNSLTLFVIIGVLFIIYGAIKYFFLEKNGREQKKKVVHQHNVRQHAQKQQLHHAPMRQQPQQHTQHHYTRADNVMCPRCGTKVASSANFCPSCGFRRSQRH
ncbi:zinc ribbon domain-containing protein [Candidatus Woesearchaeota archaeon]|jgi:hypothetical protein|nr:zinc ribbon domain-containing protein [Candidatus Woesearchaeota archaeon]MBT3537110.1 zinc ribbon domain-containing protein [Candidatus Woesearchaeota archaeon]MBT4716459.1 zinc ribbon domain-containing protein [Candidatus Woesearchaeota archaeon]MBT7106580.1 zinc ribbon domain-containing protein [Candidatus Woesearchaeota archaeon]MBT7931045.1 zinc ribbon domain-containing protein [Candidatus Woesearchaeota archaeon]